MNLVTDTGRTQTGSQKLRDSQVKDLPPPQKGNRIVYDSEVRGLGIRVTKAGAKAFIFNYTIYGRERRITIGPFPEWRVAAAREQAKEYRIMVDKGLDPLQRKQDYIDAPTMQDLWNTYEAKHLPSLSKGSQVDQRSMFKNHILPVLGKMRIADIKFQHVHDLHMKMSLDKPIRANRTLEVIRKAFNLAIQWEWIEKNPCLGIKKNTEQPRTRYLNPKEIKSMLEILDRHKGNSSANILKLLLLTGARKGEVLKASWNQFDLDAGLWVKPSAHTKQRREHRVPLSKDTLKLLKSLKAASTSDRLFPGKGKDGYQTDLKKFWDGVKRDTAFADV